MGLTNTRSNDGAMTEEERTRSLAFWRIACRHPNRRTVRAEDDKVCRGFRKRHGRKP
jgi:hypothetical protein